jgi:hypothetical protein
VGLTTLCYYVGSLENGPGHSSNEQEVLPSFFLKETGGEFPYCAFIKKKQDVQDLQRTSFTKRRAM